MSKVKPKLSKNYKFRDTEEVMAHLLAVLEMSEEALDGAQDFDIGNASAVRIASDECYETLEALRKDKFIQRIFFGSRW